MNNAGQVSEGEENMTKNYRYGRRLGQVFAAIPVCTLLIAGATNAPAQEMLSIATMPIGSAYHGMGAGIAKVLTGATPHRFVVKPYAGTNAWMPVLEVGDIQLGAINGLDAAWAHRGESGYKAPVRKLRLIVLGNSPIVTFGVLRDSPIKSLADLKGKRVASGYGGSQVISRYLDNYLFSVNFTWNDVQPVPVPDYVSGMRALREGRTDAAFLSDPNTALPLEVDAAVGLRPLNFADMPPAKVNEIPKNVLDNLSKTLPSASPAIGHKGYGYLKEDATMLKVGIYLATSTDVDEKIIYDVTKALFEKDTELAQYHPWLKDWKAATMANEDPPAPYHEGAVRYLKETGRWTPKLEANQKRLLEGN